MVFKKPVFAVPMMALYPYCTHAYSVKLRYNVCADPLTLFPALDDCLSQSLMVELNNYFRNMSTTPSMLMPFDMVFKKRLMK